ncbi:MAG TPA: hypothetical protein PLL33_03850 [Paracoccus sp. (in: a-proteobacteria)]|nr:hypothetical protein [Paracoccus sp. (in: a-proteobacteria)]
MQKIYAEPCEIWRHFEGIEREFTLPALTGSPEQCAAVRGLRARLIMDAVRPADTRKGYLGEASLQAAYVLDVLDGWFGWLHAQDQATDWISMGNCGPDHGREDDRR